ncbi:hypothetical protein NQL31_003821 [Lotmaria passim]
MTSHSTYVRVAPSPRLKDTQTTAPAELVRLRVQHLLPRTTQRARVRVGQLKTLFTVPTEMMLRDHASAQAATLQRLRLVKSVRNIKVQSGDGGGGSDGAVQGVTGALCLPFQACAALPLLASPRGASTPLTTASAESSAWPLSCVLTGSVDGLLTLWDAERCSPLCSQSTYTQGRGWGRVKSIAVYPSSSSSPASAGVTEQCFAFTASMFQSEVRVWRVAEAESTEENEEEGQGQARPPSVSLQPLTTASVNEATAMTATTTAQDATAASGAPVAVGGLQQVAVDPTGALLAATHASGLVHVWDARSLLSSGSSEGTAAPLQHLYAQDGYETAGATLGLTFHPDGSLLTTSDAGGRVVAWDTRSGQLAFHTGGRVGGHLRAARCVAWSPCGIRLASGGADGVVHLYDARKLSKAGNGAHNDGASGAAPFQLLGHDDAITSLSFYSNPCRASSTAPHDEPSVLPLGLVTTSLDHTLRVWDADTGLCVRSCDAGVPLYGHCRPALQPLSDRLVASTAVVAVGHGKNWLQYDIGLRGEVLDDAADSSEETGEGVFSALPASRRSAIPGKSVEVMENDIVASAHGATGGMKFSVVTAAAARQAVNSPDDRHRHDEITSSSDEDEEEDEMMALMKTTAKPTSSLPGVSETGRPADVSADNDSDDDEESSEDEMERLKKK